MWNTESQDTNSCLQINCMGNNYNVGNLSGLPLVEKIKSIARENQLNKFDTIDASNTKVEPHEIESGDFTGPLTIIRFNVAAAPKSKPAAKSFKKKTVARKAMTSKKRRAVKRQ